MNAAVTTTKGGAEERQPATRVLVVEDEEAFVDALTVGLSREGFEVEIARDGGEALRRFDEIHPDLVLLDVMLPTVSGIDVCRELRQHSQVPIIMVTAKAAEIDTVVGLEVGADDYVAKPYRMRELVARMRAVLRRQAGRNEVVEEQLAGNLLIEGAVELDIARHEVRVHGQQVDLPLKEFEVLALLMENAGRVLQRSTLIDRVWGHDYVGDTKTLDVHIKRLRAKVEDDPSSPSRITTIRGLGYKFNAA
ncbi:MAG: response regulator transcription factor [Microthrixaceae bacterium]|nr:response regulator transcription factor [Microthrixaceae bacterium]MCB1012665.1 response regulator transcription factor [Microthrixaceae bacterium]